MSPLHAEDAPPVPKEPTDQFLSVLVHREWIFASTPKGIYRASPHDKKWVAIPMPDNVPRTGGLAKQEPASSLIYYFALRMGSGLTSATAGKTFGLYRFDPRGDKWELVSSKYNFFEIYVRDDWSIYGIDEPVPDGASASNPHHRVLRMSSDSGKLWKDIPHPAGIAPEMIFPDPDHEGLVCVRSHDFVLQADDHSYRWRLERVRDWRETQNPVGPFFDCPTSTCSSKSLFYATLGNYFDYPFGREIAIPAFEIDVATSYDFQEGTPVVVPIKVAFRESPGVAVTLVDTERGLSAWEVKRVLPSGAREILCAGANSRDVGSEKRVFFDDTVCFELGKTVVRPGPDNLRRYRLTTGKSYTRSLNLSEVCDFSKPGKYHVQLTYNSYLVADAAKGEWDRDFSSRVFIVNIKPNGF
jgi:hypothetical protein